MTHFIKQITWARWRYHDPYAPKYFTTFTATIPQPSFEFPIACAMMSISNAKSKVFIRFASLQALMEVFVVPGEYLERLKDSFNIAMQEASKLQVQLKTVMKMGDIAPGGQIVRTDTGEVIAEAERILKGSKGR